MKKVLGTLFVTTVAVVLAIYSAMRSLDFINLTLPPDQAAMGYLALVATEGGIFCWLIYYLHGANGAWQRGIALVMTLIDLVGSIALFTADTLLQAGRNGLAVGLAPVLSADWMRDTRARYTAALGSGVIPSAQSVIDARSRDAGDQRSHPSKQARKNGATLVGEPIDLHEADKEQPETQPQAQAPQVDPALLAAIMAAMAATSPAQPSPNGNGHNKPAHVTYQAETAGLPPLSPAGPVGSE